MRRKCKAKPVTFRLYPEGSWLYAEVNVWPTKKAMYEHKPLQRNHEASCTGTTIIRFTNGKQRKLGLFAELNFYRRYLGTACITHEITHAAFSWADRVKLPLNEISDSPLSGMSKGATLPQDGPEERFCYALGKMCKQFVDSAYKLGLYS